MKWRGAIRLVESPNPDVHDPDVERLAAQVAAAVWRVAVEPGATYDRALVWSIVGRACEMLREHYDRG
jgi:hypothetical protein